MVIGTGAGWSDDGLYWLHCFFQHNTVRLGRRTRPAYAAVPAVAAWMSMFRVVFPHTILCMPTPSDAQVTRQG